MADITIAATLSDLTNERDSINGPYWMSPSIGFVVIVDISSELSVYGTVDSGASWALKDNANNPVTTSARSMAVWSDQETPGNSGTLLNIAWVQSVDNEVHYATFDMSDSTWGTDRTIDALTISATSGDTDVGITVSVSGRVYICARGDHEQDVENTNHSMRSSSDGFASNNESELSPYSSDEEVVKLLPGADADEDDICAVVYDVINADLEFWKFDASGNSWGVTAIDAGVLLDGTEARTYKGGFDAAIRHSDEHILVVYWNDVNAATADFKSVDITQATPTITAKANIDTDTANSMLAAIQINQQNDDVRVAYAGSDAGDETWTVTVVIYYKLSSDGMGSWGTEQAYGIQNDDLRAISAGHSVAYAGGRWMPAWYNDDTQDLLVHDGNDVEIAAAPFATLTGTALPSATEMEIADGGETVIIVLTGDTWVAVGATFDAQRQAIIDGFDAAASPALGWNDEVRDKAPTSVAVRTNNTTVTMTWTSDASAYDILGDETVTVIIPALALTTSGDPITADETFEITFIAFVAKHFMKLRRKRSGY